MSSSWVNMYSESGPMILPATLQTLVPSRHHHIILALRDRTGGRGDASQSGLGQKGGVIGTLEPPTGSGRVFRPEARFWATRHRTRY